MRVSGCRYGIIERIEGSNTYRLNADGQRGAIFYTKLHDRLLRHGVVRGHQLGSAGGTAPISASCTCSR